MRVRIALALAARNFANGIRARARACGDALFTAALRP